jgi:DNA-binding LacI/PurR family transcriptional regulator
LSTIRRDTDMLGRVAVELVLRAMDQPDPMAEFHDWVPVRLVVRGTTGPARHVEDGRLAPTYR